MTKEGYPGVTQERQKEATEWLAQLEQGLDKEFPAPLTEDQKLKRTKKELLLLVYPGRHHGVGKEYLLEKYGEARGAGYLTAEEALDYLDTILDVPDYIK